MKNAFVASWFFPPSNTAEAVVAYKLLKHSAWHYDVASSASLQWTYKNTLPLHSDNLRPFSCVTNELSEWMAFAEQTFYDNEPTRQYGFIMTRSMPPESHMVGLSLKRRNPNTFWVATFGDPVANNPYELNAFRETLPRLVGRIAVALPNLSVPLLRVFTKNTYAHHLRALQKLEKKVFALADLLVFPTLEQCIYSLGRNIVQYKHKCAVIPHSFDSSLYPVVEEETNEKMLFAFLGHADHLRNPRVLLDALVCLQKKKPELLCKIEIHLIGNTPDFIKDAIRDLGLELTVIVKPPVDYITSLGIMEKADYLIHLDAVFDFLDNTTIFLASKLADYVGSGKPIVGFTSPCSPAAKLITEYGSIIFSPQDSEGFATFLSDCLSHKITHAAKPLAKYSAEAAAAEFDDCITCKSGNAERLLG